MENEDISEYIGRIRTLKQQGIRGWGCIFQVVADKRNEARATPQQRAEKFNRVEIAFANLPKANREALLVLAAHVAQKKCWKDVNISPPKDRLRDYNANTRASIALALKLMSDTRSLFGLNLKHHEFHPEGAARW